MTPPPGSRKPGFIVTLGLLTGAAAMTVDMSLPAIPDMVRALHTTLPLGQKIVGIFLAGMAFGQIPAGLISDRIGRLPVLYGGVLLFVAAAIVAALARDVTVMLCARFVQGFGAAAPIVLSRAIVRDLASGAEAARLMSLMTIVFTAAPIIAPTFGAALVSLWGWRSPFVAIALLAVIMLVLMRVNLFETRLPDRSVHPVRQLAHSIREFFRHRQSVFGYLLLALPPAGFMSIITVSAGLAVSTYGISVTAYGFIFATAGLSVLSGSALNRVLVARFDSLWLIGAGCSMMAVSAVQLLLIAWIDHAPFAWFWSCVCLFMSAVALTMPNATVIAMDPLPRTAGVASSIIGTSQNVSGACGALLGASLYDGTLRNAVIIMATVGCLMSVLFLLRPVIVPGGMLRHGD